MPRVRESLESVKARLAREQRTGTERRVEALLRPKLTGQDAEILDDSEEEDRLSGRRARRANRQQATQTNSSSSSFCCGVLGGVSLLVCLACSLILYKANA
jgi:hypothetical protein